MSNFVGVAGVIGTTSYSGTEPVSTNHGPIKTTEGHHVHWGTTEHSMKRLSLSSTIKLGGVVGTPAAGMLQWTGSAFQGYTGGGWINLDPASVSLDAAYRVGGTITADVGSVVINASGTSTEALYLSGATTQLAQMIYPGSGQGLYITSSSSLAEAIHVSAGAGQAVTVSATGTRDTVDLYAGSSGACLYALNEGTGSVFNVEGNRSILSGTSYGGSANVTLAYLAHSSSLSSNYTRHGLHIDYTRMSTWDSTQPGYGVYLQGKANASSSSTGVSYGTYIDSGWEVGIYSLSNIIVSDEVVFGMADTSGTVRGSLCYDLTDVRLTSASSLKIASTTQTVIDSDTYVDIFADTTSQFTVTDPLQHLVIQTTGAASYVQVQATQGDVEISGHNLDLNAISGGITMDATSDTHIKTSVGHIEMQCGAWKNLTINAVPTYGDGYLTIKANGTLDITTETYSAGGSTATINVKTGNASGTDTSGVLNLGTGTASGGTGGTGYVGIFTGSYAGTSSASGKILMFTGTSTNSASGYIDIYSGSSSATSSGYVALKSGALSHDNDYATGPVTIASGDNSGSVGNGSPGYDCTGSVIVESGDYTGGSYGNSGDVIVRSGASNGYYSGDVYMYTQAGWQSQLRGALYLSGGAAGSTMLPGEVSRITLGTSGSLRMGWGSGSPVGYNPASYGYSQGSLYIDTATGALYSAVSSNWTAR